MARRASRRKADSSGTVRVPTVAQTNVQLSEELPRIEGPKTGPFKGPGHRKSLDFSFEELLDKSSSSGGGEGYVFKATLNGQAYAIKIFKFYDIEKGRFPFSRSQNAQITNEELVGNLDPFNAECRAYGRIEQIRAKYRAKKADIGPIAVPCYGHIEIDRSQEGRIVAQYGALDFQRFGENMNAPLRALVKQYNPHAPIDPKKRSVKLMLRDLKIMHENGLYPIDIRAENYREGLLVDFGMALTTPSCVLRVVSEFVANHERWSGLGAFDEMIRDAGVKTQVRATAGPEWRFRTRAGTEAKGGVEMIQIENRRGTKTSAQTWKA